MKVRKAVAADAMRVVSLAHRYYEEAPYMPYAFDYNAAMASFFTAIHDPDHVFLIAVTDNLKFAGMLWGIKANPLPWTPSVSAMDILFYVGKEHRGSRAAVSLVREYEAWAKASGCDEVILSTSSGLDMDRTTGFYKRLGYKLVGYQLQKEVKDGSS